MVYCCGIPRTPIIIKLSLMKIPQLLAPKAVWKQSNIKIKYVVWGWHLFSFGPQSVQPPSHAPHMLRAMHMHGSLTMVSGLLPITEDPFSSIPSTLISKHVWFAYSLTIFVLHGFLLLWVGFVCLLLFYCYMGVQISSSGWPQTCEPPVSAQQLFPYLKLSNGLDHQFSTCGL